MTTSFGPPRLGRYEGARRGPDLHDGRCAARAVESMQTEMTPPAVCTWTLSDSRLNVVHGDERTASSRPGAAFEAEDDGRPQRAAAVLLVLARRAETLAALDTWDDEVVVDGGPPSPAFSP